MPLNKLNDLLKKNGSGDLTSSPDYSNIVNLLAQCWPNFTGSGSNGMTAAKIRDDRLESTTWNPPCIEFDIERHGGIILGSTRAEIYSWSVDLVTQSAISMQTGRRQVKQQAPKWFAAPEAQKFADLINKGLKHEGLEWKSPERVRILIDKIIPGSRPASQKDPTKQRRSKQFRTELEKLLKPTWRRSNSFFIKNKTH